MYFIALPRLHQYLSGLSRLSIGRFWQHSAGRAGLVRALMIPITGLATLATAHLEIARLGAGMYGVLTLLVGVTLLLPFADLGVGAAVTSAAARREQVAAVFLSGFRLLLRLAAALILLAVALSVARVWAPLTGIAPESVSHLDWDMLGVMIAFAFALPLGLGGRVLLGYDRYSRFLLLQSATPGIILALVWFAAKTHFFFPYLLAPFVAQLVISAIAFVLALRAMSVSVRNLPTLLKRNPRIKFRSTAGPMMVITIGLPVALQTDRLVLSHLASTAALTDYALVATLYVPAWSIVTSAGTTLWPRFTRIRVEDEAAARIVYLRMLRIFCAVGCAFAVALVALGPVVTRLWAGSAGAPFWLWFTFGLLLLVQAAHLPGGMYLTDPNGLRFQAYCVTGMCLANLPLSICLTPILGAKGPVIASVVTIFVLQFGTTFYRILRPGFLAPVTSA